MDEFCDKNDNAKCFVKGVPPKLWQQRNNNNLNGKHCNDIANCDKPENRICLSDPIEIDVEQSQLCTAKEEPHFIEKSSISENNVCSEINGDKTTLGAHDLLIDKFEDVTDQLDNKSGDNSSMDNLSFMSENDIIDDIVILPNNLISEDEISSNSDDCIYAYRGGDIDPLGIQPRASQDDETDFLEMDFDPDPASEVEIYTNEYNGVASDFKGKVAEEDIKIPREIDKIAEVVQLNNIRSRDNESNKTSLSQELSIDKNYILCASTPVKKQTDCVNILLEKQKPIAAVDSDAIILLNSENNGTTIKHTGTKPKKLSTPKQTYLDETRQPKSMKKSEIMDTNFNSSNNIVTPLKLNGICLNTVEERCLDCSEMEFFNNSKWSGIDQCNLCRKCKYNQRHTMKNDDQNKLLYEKNQRIFDGSESNWENIKDTKTHPKPLFKNNYLDCDLYEKPLNMASQLDLKLETESVTIYSIDCNEKIIVQALQKLGVNPNIEILKTHFENVLNINTTRMSVPEYIVHISKINCNYKELMDVIQFSCISDVLKIDFFPMDSFMTSPETVRVKVVDIISRWNTNTDLKDILRIKNKHFNTMNVLGKLANVIRQHAHRLETDADIYINIPHYYKGGYICIAKLS